MKLPYKNISHLCSTKKTCHDTYHKAESWVTWKLNNYYDESIRVIFIAAVIKHCNTVHDYAICQFSYLHKLQISTTGYNLYLATTMMTMLCLLKQFLSRSMSILWTDVNVQEWSGFIVTTKIFIWKSMSIQKKSINAILSDKKYSSKLCSWSAFFVRYNIIFTILNYLIQLLLYFINWNFKSKQIKFHD